MPPSNVLPWALWDRVLIGDGCWEWQGTTNRPGGYGYVAVGGKRWLSHRLSWVLVNGPIPDGRYVLHHCDNPPCVRPDHLYIGDQFDNMRDAVSRDRLPSRAGEANGRARLTAADVKRIRKECAAGRAQIDIARELGVKRSIVSEIVRGHKWVHV